MLYSCSKGLRGVLQMLGSLLLPEACWSLNRWAAAFIRFCWLPQLCCDGICTIVFRWSGNMEGACSQAGTQFRLIVWGTRTQHRQSFALSQDLLLCGASEHISLASVLRPLTQMGGLKG